MHLFECLPLCVGRLIFTYEKINNKITEIKNKLINQGFTNAKIEELLNKRKTLFPYNTESLLTIVSGKDFIIPFLKHHINKQLNCSLRLPNEAWKFNFVDNCDLNRLQSLKQAIIELV